MSNFSADRPLKVHAFAEKPWKRLQRNRAIQMQKLAMFTRKARSFLLMLKGRVQASGSGEAKWGTLMAENQYGRLQVLGGAVAQEAERRDAVPAACAVVGISAAEQHPSCFQTQQTR